VFVRLKGVLLVVGCELDGEAAEGYECEDVVGGRECEVVLEEGVVRGELLRRLVVKTRRSGEELTAIKNKRIF
jgi:hypothetical protein